jgi:hypothetical protein
MGGMKIRKYITYKVIAALLFPPFIFAIQFRSAAELQYMPQTQEEYEQERENKEELASQDDAAEFHDVLNDSIHYRQNSKSPPNDNEANRSNCDVKPDGDSQEMVSILFLLSYFNR